MSTSANSTGVAVFNDTASSFNLMVRQAEVLSQSRIIPRAYQGKQYDIIAAGLAGQSFGWDLMTSLRNYHVIEGTASLRPEAMLGLVRQHGHSVSVSVYDGTRDGVAVRVAKAVGHRRDNGDEHVAEFDTFDAKRAGLLGKNNWKQYEDAMLTWRSVSSLCRVLFPDVVLGAGYVPEELGAIVTATGEVVEDDPFASPVVTPGMAKTELLAACNGDKDKARALWGDRGSSVITAEELDALIAQAKQDEVVVAELEPAATPAMFEVVASYEVDDAGEVIAETLEQAFDPTGPVPFPKRAALGSRARVITNEQETQQ